MKVIQTLLIASTMATPAIASSSQLENSFFAEFSKVPTNEQIASIEAAFPLEYSDIETENPCANLTLSEAQRAQIHHMATQSKQRFEHLQGRLMETRRAYGHNIVANNSSPQRAHRLDAQSDEITKNLSAIGHNLITGILFHVATPEQRIPTALCIQHSQKEQLKRRLKEICENLKP